MLAPVSFLSEGGGGASGYKRGFNDNFDNTQMGG